MKVERVISVAIPLLALTAVGLAFTTLGSPRHQRELAIDDQRVQRLYRLAVTVNEDFEGRASSLPRVLPRDPDTLDPITNQPFEYRRIDKARYELCTTFNLATDSAHERENYMNPERWSHGAGHVCYHLNKNTTWPTRH